MAATITDKIMVASSGTRPNPTTLTAQKSVGASLLSADDLTGWGTSTPVTFVLYKIDSNGNEVVGSRTDWKGIVSGNTITQLTLTAGTDTIYPAGSPVIAAATARWADDLTAAALVSLNQNGTLKDSTVGNTTIVDGSVTTSKVADDAVNDNKLDYPRWYQEIGRTTLGVAGDTITVSGLPARKYLKVVYSIINSGSVGATIRFNGDSGSNYGWRKSLSGASDTTSAPTSGLAADGGGASYPLHGSLEIINMSSVEKVATGFVFPQAAAGSATAPVRLEFAGKWANTSAQISSISFNNLDSGDYAAGSEVVVLGHD